MFDIKLIDFIWEDEISVLIIANNISNKAYLDR